MTALFWIRIDRAPPALVCPRVEGIWWHHWLKMLSKLQCTGQQCCRWTHIHCCIGRLQTFSAEDVSYLTSCSTKFWSVAFRVRRRSRRTFSTDFEIFRRRFDGAVIYFFNSDFKSFDDAPEFFSLFFLCCFCFLFKVHVNFSLMTLFSFLGTTAIVRSSIVLLSIMISFSC